jgi:hypothetical protein
MNVFVSVGVPANPEQEAFVRAVEERLRSEGLVPQTVGRTYFTADSPFIGVNKLMDECRGVIVIALERIFLSSGTERRGGPLASTLHAIKLPTPWNQIEAAFGYSRKLPIFVIVEQGVRQDGLLEKGFDWYVITTVAEPPSLATAEFNGVLASWKQKLTSSNSVRAEPRPNAGEMTVMELMSTLKASQLWALLVAAAVCIGGAFTLGTKLEPMLTPSAKHAGTNSDAAVRSGRE